MDLDTRNSLFIALAVIAALVLMGTPEAGVFAALLPPSARNRRGSLEPTPLLPVRFIVGLALSAVGWARHGRHRRRHARDVERLLLRHGASSVAWFALDRGTDYFWSHDHRAVIAYRPESDALLVIGDPIGPQEELRTVLEEFAEYCREKDRPFAFYQARPEHLPLYASLGWRALHIGEDPVIWTDDDSLDRVSIGDVHRAARRAEAGGLRVLHAMPGVANGTQEAPPAELWHELRSVSKEWARSRRGGGRGFCGGRFDPSRMRHEWLAIAWDPVHRRIEAFACWVPIPARRGWALDLVRRRPVARPGALELLVVSSLEHARRRGDDMLSLSLTPVAFVPPTSARDKAEPLETVDGARALLQQHLSRLYDFPGAEEWKRRLEPTLEDRYLVVPGTWALPPVVLALVRAQGLDDPVPATAQARERRA